MTQRVHQSGSLQRFVIAGLGGITSVLLSLVVIDLQTLLLDLTPLAVASYAIRVLALFALGGLVGWLNRTESDAVKLFQIGIAAPALITAALNGARITLPDHSTETYEHRAGTSGMLVSQAYAQSSKDKVKQFSLPQETATQQIYRGLFGATPQNVWFVISGSQPTIEAAERQAEDIRRKGFQAEVYQPWGSNPYYAVVIGSQLTLAEARALRMKALKSGLPNDTYLWTFPPQR